MKRFLLAAALAALSSPVFADHSVVVVGQPGYYGTLDINGYPDPQYYNARPVVITRSAGMTNEPMYLRVPQDQRLHWAANCDAYDACGQPVYFVQDRWYSDVYSPQYRTRYGVRNDDRDDRRWHRDDRDDRRWNNDRVTYQYDHSRDNNDQRHQHLQKGHEVTYLEAAQQSRDDYYCDRDGRYCYRDGRRYDNRMSRRY